MANHEEQCNCDQALELRKLLVEAQEWIVRLDDRLDFDTVAYQGDPELDAFQDRLDKHWAFKEPAKP